jgi:hypothetical protein
LPGGRKDHPEGLKVMICKNCGHSVSKNDDVCQSCGLAVDEVKKEETPKPSKKKSK